MSTLIIPENKFNNRLFNQYSSYSKTMKSNKMKILKGLIGALIVPLNSAYNRESRIRDQLNHCTKTRTIQGIVIVL